MLSLPIDCYFTFHGACASLLLSGPQLPSPMKVKVNGRKPPHLEKQNQEISNQEQSGF